MGFGSIRRFSLVALAATAVLVPASEAAASGCPGARVKPTAANAAKVRSATICLLNRERGKRGLSRVRGDAKLRRAATLHSRDMVRRRYFDHVTPGGQTLVHRARRVKYLTARSSWFLAENIAYGSGRRGSPASIVRQWMNSPPHRANILNQRVRDVGVGVAIGSPNGGRGATYTLNFGRLS